MVWSFGLRVCLNPEIPLLFEIITRTPQKEGNIAGRASGLGFRGLVWAVGV